MLFKLPIRYNIILKMILSEIIQEARKSELAEYISGQHFYARILQIRNNQPQDIERQGLTIQLPLQIAQADKEKIQNIAKEVSEKLKSEVEIQFQQKVALGSKLPNFGQISRVFQQGSAQLSAKEGQVLLIDVWATWCGPCQKPMDHNQKMIEKNPEWVGKVRIVGVSVDQEIDSVKNRVQTKGWKSVEHLTLGGWNHDHKLIRSFGISGIPFVCLVDTFGNICFTGHPSSINLQQKINSLLKAQVKEQKPSHQSSSSYSLTEQQIKNLQNTICKKQFFDTQFGKLNFISTKVVVKQQASKGKISSQATITVYVNEQDKEFLQKYESLVPKNAKFEKKFVKREVVPPVPKNCFQCKEELKYPLYWCRWSKNPEEQFRCKTCGERKIDQTHYGYDQNSILLLKQTKSYPSAAIGQNIQPAGASINQLSAHAFGCNGCGGCPATVGEARYICLGCRSEPNPRGDYVDLCQQCLDKLAKDDQSVIENLKSENHQPSHCFLRVLYNVKNYYDY